jgi:hypothetical protein
MTASESHCGLDNRAQLNPIKLKAVIIVVDTCNSAPTAADGGGWKPDVLSLLVPSLAQLLAH